MIISTTVPIWNCTDYIVNSIRDLLSLILKFITLSDEKDCTFPTIYYVSLGISGILRFILFNIEYLHTELSNILNTVHIANPI